MEKNIRLLKITSWKSSNSKITVSVKDTQAQSDLIKIIPSSFLSFPLCYTMDPDVLTSSPFCSSRAEVTFTRYAIILNEQRKEVEKETSSLAQDRRPDTPMQNDIRRIREILQDCIKSHSGEEPGILTADKVIRHNRNNLALVPIMYRIAQGDFAKTCKKDFKIIECRHETKLVSDWKATLPDTLITLKHQVIVVQVQEPFLPYNDFAYGILRQLNYNWKLRLPRSCFYPNDAFTVEATHERDLIVVTPSLPDGNLEILKKMSSLNYELITMFKNSCRSAMKNLFQMRDLQIGTFQDASDAVAEIKDIIGKLQDRLKTGGEIRLGSSSRESLYESLRQMESIPHPMDDTINYGNKVGLDDEDEQDEEECKEPLDSGCTSTTSTASTTGSTTVSNTTRTGTTSIKSRIEEITLMCNGSNATGNYDMKNKEFTLLDKKLCKKFDKIQALISSDPVKRKLKTVDEITSDDQGKGDKL